MSRIAGKSVFTSATLLAVIAMLTGCASLDANFAEYNAKYRLQPGDVLVLETDLPFPKGHARVKMQGDGPVGAVDEYHPYCEMEVSVVSDGGFKLLPDRFEVWKFDQQILPWNIVSVPMRVAANDADSESQITYVSDIWLRSDRQPEARKLSCRHVVEPEDREHVSVADMREALQGVFRIVRQ